MPTVERALSPKQRQSIREATARINIWHGAVRSSKTIGSLVRWLIYVAGAPLGGVLVISGKTTDTVARNVFGPLQDPGLFGEMSRHVHHTRGAPTGTILGRTVEIITANDARAEARLRGLTCAGAYVDEATLVPEAFWTQLLARLSVPGAKLFATTNPDNPSHWLRAKFLARADELDLASWHFTLDDNPSLDPAYVAALKVEYTGLWYKRFILGQWVQAEGAVYDMWDPDRMVIPAAALPPVERWLCLGVDYGTANPFAGLLLAVGADRRLYLADEWRWDSRLKRRQLTDAEYSTRVRGWLGAITVPGDPTPRRIWPQWTAVDPSAASFKVQLHQDGWPGLVDADNDVLYGIRLVSSLLAADKLRVVDRCTGWIEEAPGYAWDETAAEKGEDKPIKVGDHSLDGGRYAVATTEQAWRPLVQLVQGAA